MLGRTAEGEETPTFEEYARLRAEKVRRLAYVRLGNRQDAEDAAQEVLAILYRKWASATRDGTPDAYMRKVLENYLNGRWRFLRRRPSELPLDYDELEAVGAVPADDDPANGVADRAFLRECLAVLPLRQQQVMLLRHRDDLDDHEIARLLGIAESTVRRHAMEGTNRLREVMAERSRTP